MRVEKKENEACAFVLHSLNREGFLASWHCPRCSLSAMCAPSPPVGRRALPLCHPRHAAAPGFTSRSVEEEKERQQ